MNNKTILRLENVVKRFGDLTVLHGINLDIQEGEFLTIVGPSGSGKTTLIRLLVGIDEVTEGHIKLHGEKIEGLPANRRPTCMVFQSLALFPHRSVGENIEFPLKIRGEEPNKRRERALELLALLQLPKSYYDKRIHECSGGERQRVALARALAFDPEILFFDEPLSALDYRLRKTLEKELKELHERTGKTFVYITHSLEEAMVMSDRIAILRDGHFEQIADANDIYTKPVNEFVAKFMGDVNLFKVKCDQNGQLHGDGSDIHVSVEGTALNLAPGQQGTLVVRPESLRFVDSTDKTDFSVQGVLHAEYTLGSRIQYKIDSTDGSEIAVEKLRQERYQGLVSDKVILGWNTADAHLISANDSTSKV